MVKSRWPKRIVKVLGIVVLAVVVLAVAAKYWIVPAVARWQVGKQLAKYWDGATEIESIDFGFFGPTRVAGLTIKDRQGRTWLSVGSVELVLEGWPGLSPVLTGIKVQSVHGTAHFDAGRCNPPLREFPKESKEPSKYVDLHEIAVNGVRLKLAGTEAKVALLGEMNLSLRRQGDKYLLSLAAPAPDDANAGLSVTGSLPAGEGSAFEVSLKLRRSVTPEELKSLLRILNVSRELTGSTELVVMIAAKGSTGEEFTVHPKGRIELKAPKVSTDTGNLIKDLAISANVTGDGRNVVVTGGIDRGTCSRGLVAGKFSAGMGLTGGLSTLEYSGRLGVRNLSLPNLELTLSGKTKMRSGELKSVVSFEGKGLSLERLRYHGEALLKDVDPRGDNPLVKLLVAVFRQMSIDPARIVGGSNLHVVFRGEGLKVTLVQEARLENNISALVAEAGGVIHLAAETLDVHVIGAPVKQLRTVMSSLLGGALSGVADKLTRLRVHGPWASPIISKEPAKDIKEGTVAFFRGVAGGGGKLGGALLKPLEGLFKGRNSNKK